MPYIGRSSNFGVRTRFLYTATASQTTFSGTDTQNLTLSYSDSNFIDVHQNGVLLKVVDDYTATSGTSVVLATGATASDVIEITVYDVFSIANHIKKTGDAMAGALTNIDIDGTELVLDADGDTSITADTDDQIDFRAGGTDVMALSTTGLTITNASNATQLTLKSTDDDANGGPLLDLTRDSASPADNDAMGSIRFRSDDDGGNETQFVDITGYAPDVSDGSEDGQLQIRTIVGGTLRNRLDLASGETVFNEDSVDLDFRVESNTLTHGLFVEGATGNVMIGTSVAGRSQEGAERLTIADTGHSGLTIRSGTENYGIIHFSDSEGGAGEYAGQIYYAHGGLGENLVFATQGRNRVKVTGDVEIVDGNLKVASGHGVDFSATGDGSGTDTSELFDDYEEGTFTPTLTSGASSISYNHQYGFYTKVGRVVHFELDISMSSASGNSNLIKFGGLPYSSADITQLYGGAFLNYQTQMFADGADYMFHVGRNTQEIAVYQSSGNSFVGTSATLAQRIIMSGRYFAST